MSSTVAEVSPLDGGGMLSARIIDDPIKPIQSMNLGSHVSSSSAPAASAVNHLTTFQKNVTRVGTVPFVVDSLCQTLVWCSLKLVLYEH